MKQQEMRRMKARREEEASTQEPQSISAGEGEKEAQNHCTRDHQGCTLDDGQLDHLIQQIKKSPRKMEGE